MIDPVRELCVVYLVRAHDGVEPFIRFLESYRLNPGGVEHDLLIVFKGFDPPQDAAEYRELLAPFGHTTLDVPDEGFDITAYIAAFKRYSKQYRYFCFLNSYSLILDCDWLRKLHENISKSGVGLVGATGSWQSHRWNVPSWMLPFKIATWHYRHSQDNRVFERVMSAISEAWRQSPFHVSFDRFPNYHIRTNAFMISSVLMKKIKCPTIRTKADAHRFESGKKGLTKQVLGMGKRVVVVGKDGVGYEKKHWHKSGVYRHSEQENLLISDNQTCDYQDGTLERRIWLVAVTWGETGRENSNEEKSL